MSADRHHTPAQRFRKGDGSLDLLVRMARSCHSIELPYEQYVYKCQQILRCGDSRKARPTRFHADMQAWAWVAKVRESAASLSFYAMLRPRQIAVAVRNFLRLLLNLAEQPSIGRTTSEVKL